jgi:hypothetical protein
MAPPSGERHAPQRRTNRPRRLHRPQGRDRRELDRLKALSDEHFGQNPDDINWGHVGTLAHYAALLQRITAAAFKEGEYAA